MDVDGNLPVADGNARTVNFDTLIRAQADQRSSTEPGADQAQPHRLCRRYGFGHHLDNRSTLGDANWSRGHESERCGLGDRAVDAQWHGNEGTAPEQGTVRNVQLVGGSRQVTGCAALGNDLDQSIDECGVRADGNGHGDERSFVIGDRGAAQLDTICGGQPHLRLLGETVDAGWRQAAQIGASNLEQIALSSCKKIGRHTVDARDGRCQQDLGRVRAIVRQRVSALIEDAESTQSGSGRSGYLNNSIDSFTAGVNLEFHDAGVVSRI